MIYRARDRQTGYGRPVGILSLEEHIPCPPGTPGNPTTFAHPVIYEIVRGVGIASLQNLNHPDGSAAFIAAGEALVARGAAAVAGNCGLMIVHQQTLANALPVPVLMSSLLQLPLLQRQLGPHRRVGVIASNDFGLKPEHLRLAGADLARTALASMAGQPHFRAAMTDSVLNFDEVEAEAAQVARRMVDNNPDIGALLLECVDLPPYAAAIQAATGLPVFDITTLIAQMYSSLARNRFVGVY